MKMDDRSEEAYFLLTSRALARIILYLKNTFLDNFTNRLVS